MKVGMIPSLSTDLFERGFFDLFCTLRNNWLKLPEWTKTEVLEFPGSVDGPWKRYVVEPNEKGIGTV